MCNVISFDENHSGKYRVARSLRLSISFHVYVISASLLCFFPYSVPTKKKIILITYMCGR